VFKVEGWQLFTSTGSLKKNNFGPLGHTFQQSLTSSIFSTPNLTSKYYKKLYHGLYLTCWLHFAHPLFKDTVFYFYFCFKNQSIITLCYHCKKYLQLPSYYRRFLFEIFLMNVNVTMNMSLSR